MRTSVSDPDQDRAFFPESVSGWGKIRIRIHEKKRPKVPVVVRIRKKNFHPNYTGTGIYYFQS